MKETRTKELDALLNAPEDDEKDDGQKENEDNADGENKEDIEVEKKDGKEEADETEEDDENKSDDDESEESEEENDDETEEEESEEDVGGEASKQKDRWHGKSREEVIKLFEKLEHKNKPQKPAGEKQESKNDENEENEFGVPSDEELAKMTPKQFAEWMVKAVQNIVGKTYDARSKMRDSVAQEIRDAQKDHPLLRTSPEYRELVLSLIDGASQKGIVMSLKDACVKVDAFAGKVKGDVKVSDAEKIRLKKAKAQVERGAGAPNSPGEGKGAEERRLENIFGTSGSNGPLGGLGV